MNDFDEPATGPDRAEKLCISTRAHGEVWFDLSLSGHQEGILSARVPSPRRGEAAAFVDNLAAASICQLGDRKFDASDDDDKKALSSLQLDLDDDERIHFATKFLEANDFLLCRAESTTTVDADGEQIGTLEFVPRNDITWKPGPVEKLHQAWLLHVEEEATWVRKTLGPTMALDLGEARLSRWDRGFTSALFEGAAAAAIRASSGVRFLSNLDETVGRMNKMYGEPAVRILGEMNETARRISKMYEERAGVRMLTQLDATMKRLSDPYGELATKMFTPMDATAKWLSGKTMLPSLSGLEAKLSLYGSTYQKGVTGLHSAADSPGKIAAMIAPVAAKGTASLFGPFSPPSWWSRDMDVWKGFGIGPSSELRLARAAYDTATAGVISALAGKNLLGEARLVPHLLSPSHVYTSFVSDTERLWHDNPASLRTAYDSALSFGAVHLDSTLDALGRLVQQHRESEDGAAEDELPLDRTLNLLPQRREELVSQTNATSEGRLGDTTNSPVAEISLLVSEVLLLVVECNEAARIRSGSEIFTPTTRVMRAFANLTQMVPTSRVTFGDAVDDLYFVIYEGAGGDYLRFLDSPGKGGVFQKTDALVQAVFNLKFLRNKWLRHDQDHGDARKIEKSWDALRETLQALGLSHTPTAPEHFHLLYHRLLRGLAAFLAGLLQRLQASSTLAGG
jgi:hypothetical protein